MNARQHRVSSGRRLLSSTETAPLKLMMLSSDWRPQARRAAVGRAQSWAVVLMAVVASTSLAVVLPPSFHHINNSLL